MKYNDASKIFLLCLSSFLLIACAPKADTLTILHTNDTHSQVEPIAAGKRDGNHAGYARRLGVIQQERAADPNLILVDAGDFCQGYTLLQFLSWTGGDRCYEPYGLRCHYIGQS